MTRSEQGPQQDLHEQFEGNPRSHLDITGRDYDTVIKDLGLDTEVIPNGQKILVIGWFFRFFGTIAV